MEPVVANPLDFVIENQRELSPLDELKMRGISIRPFNGSDVASGGDNALTQAIAPELQGQQWTMDDLFKGLAALKEYVTTGEFSPGTKFGNRLFGTGGEERYQTWPEKLVRSGSTLAGDVASGAEPIVDPLTGRTSERVIERAQDMAGLAGGLALIERPGTTTLGSGPVRPGAKAVPIEPAPIFYSALEHAATNAAQDVMSPQQWLGYLKNQPGVKQEELRWTGIGDWLGQQKGKVKKEDVQSYLDEHKVEIKDVTKQGGHEDDFVYSERTHDTAADRVGEIMHDEFFNDPKLRKEFGDDFMEYAGSDKGVAHHDELVTEWLRENGEPLPGEGNTKYSSYQLPGGENYREHLLTLPYKVERAGRFEIQDASTPRQSWWHVIDKDGVLPNEEFKTRTQAENFVTKQDKGKVSGVAPFRSSHWDEPNVLAHVRTNDRVMGNRKSLHIEEIQSDWHRQGRKQGYGKQYTKDDIKERKGPAGDTQYYVETLGGVEGRTRHWDTPEDAIKEANNLFRNDRIPDAPFKTTWPELALKRMIRKAAEEGYDRISWTPGEAQAARYDLSKQIDAVRAAKNSDGTFYLSYRPKGQETGWKTIDKNMSKDKVPDHIGKDLAEKVTNQEVDAGYQEYSGLDLKVGGKGMREFYDKMLPKMVEKIGKAHGVKVKQTTIPSPGKQIHAETLPEHRRYLKVPDSDSQLVHYFDIPQSLRDYATSKGFPLYMSGVPFPLTPIDHDPFKKDR